jgi:hypothetical protein
MPETHVIEYQLTEDQASAAADAVLESTSVPGGATQLRSLVVKSAVYSGIAVAVMALGAWMNQPWWFFVPGALMLGVSVLLLGISGLLSAFGPWHRRQLDTALREAFRRLQSPRIRWTVTDERLTVESGPDVREFGWRDVTDVFLTGTFWILKIRNAPTMLLLADRIPDAAARFLLTRARDVGATIRVAGRPPGRPDDPE